ncbi:MAG: phosphatidate cytidylyltransferase [Candidatus Saccharibacteria bacterium]|nr:phosphatidate cytidylyltransferase [Candidatus Saccharibacteria bacterium]
MKGVIFMKSRLIGALWILGAIGFFYFAFNGEYFSSFFFFCLILCLAEILAISELRPYQMEPLACRPLGAWQIEICILVLAIFFCLAFTKEQILLVIAICSACDVGAFTCGKLFGKHKARFSESISPNKTIEGYIGGIVASALGIPVCMILGFEFTPSMIVFLCLCGLVAELGDLLGSATKRQLAIKDSGDGIRNFPGLNLLEYPLKGHGGYLDRLDSISMVAVLYALVAAPQF